MPHRQVRRHRRRRHRHRRHKRLFRGRRRRRRSPSSWKFSVTKNLPLSLRLEAGSSLKVSQSLEEAH